MTDIHDIDNAVHNVWRLKQEQKRIADELEAAQQRAVDLLEQQGQRTWIDAETGISGTVVRAVRVVYDEQGLLDALPPKVAKSVSKVVLDKAALEASIATGAIDPEVVAEHAEEKPNKPYLNVSAPDPAKARIAAASRKDLVVKRVGPRKKSKSTNLFGPLERMTET